MQWENSSGVGRAGWSEDETTLLWELAGQARERGAPLRCVFEELSRQTGRKPNSIRNYYYSQVQALGEDAPPVVHFTPFDETEVDDLVRRVLIECANGLSVRAAVQKLSGGDHSLMLRYQNKYRSVLKSRPELVASVAQELNDSGVPCRVPEIRHRERPALAPIQRLRDEATNADDPEILRMVSALERLLHSRSSGDPGVRDALEEMDVKLTRMTECAQKLLTEVKEYLGVTVEKRMSGFEAFCRHLCGYAGEMEELLEVY